MAEEPFTAEIPVRFRDLDPMGHVNNGVYATYLEQARAEFYREVLDESLAAVDTVIVHLEIDYRTPIELGETVAVSLSIAELGRSSMPMAYEVRSGGELAATAETVQVAWDREAGAARPIPDAWRRAIEGDEGRAEEG